MFDRLIFGTLYPAYSSYKAVKSKDVREYVSMHLIYNKHFMPHCIHIYSLLVFTEVQISFIFKTFLICISSGQMDDVLDNICTVHNS